MSAPADATNARADGGNVVEFEAHARLKFRGRPYELSGAGKVGLACGLVDGTYVHNLPANDFDPLVLQTVLVTGYPSVCASADGRPNPFQGGSYSYRRWVEFGPSGTIAYSARCWLEQRVRTQCLLSEFDVELDVATPALVSAEPLIEEWAANPPGIRSKFVIRWRCRNTGDWIVGKARTFYQPVEPCQEVSYRAERTIAFPFAASEGSTLHIRQVSSLREEKSR